jgi:hypothetical protein
MSHAVTVVLGALLTLAPLAVSGGWLTTAFGRRTARIQAHLNIAEKLKRGPAYDALRARAELEVMEHLAALEDATVRRWNRTAGGFAIASIAGGAGLAAILVLRLAGNVSASTLIWSSAGSISLTLVTRWAINRADRATTEAGKAEPHVA